MIPYFNKITNERELGLSGYRVGVANSDGSVAAIYADRSQTRFADASNNPVDYATADEAGFVSFWWEPVTGQILQIMDATGGQVRAIDGISEPYLLGNLGGSLTSAQIGDLPDALNSKLSASYTRDETGAVLRETSAKISERRSVLDFGADPTGGTDSTAAFQAAALAANGSEVFIPKGTYLVGNVGGLQYAGARWIGEGRFRSVVKAAPGTTGSIFGNPLKNTGTSTGTYVGHMMLDANGQDVVLVDFGSVNASIADGLRLVGGSSKANAVGVGVLFGAPLDRGSYSNSARDCNGVFLEACVRWDTGGNNNTVFGGEAIGCAIGYDIAPAGVIDTAKLFGPRVEGCDVGVAEGGLYTMIFGLRAEANAVADIEFHAGSDHCNIFGGYSASSATVLKDKNLATSLVIISDEFGRLDYENSPSRPILHAGRASFAKAGTSVATNIIHPQNDYAAYFYDYVLIRNQVGVEFGNADGDNRVIGMQVDGSNDLTVSGFDRKTSSYRTINLGGGTVRPITDATQQFGTTTRKWLRMHLSDGIYVTSKKVVGAQQPAIADGADATVNSILAAMRAHGLIAT